MSGISIVKGMTPGYGNHAVSQKQVCDYMYTKYTSKALGEILKDGKKKTVKIGDFGAADCVNTSDIYKKIKNKITDNCQIVFSIIDLPRNDWESAKKSCSIVGLPIVEAINGDEDGSRIEFAAKSFFGQCLATESVDIAFTSIAAHWFSDVSGISLHGSIDHAVHMDRTSSVDRNKMKTRGMEDGVKFLVSRAQELKSRGWLLMANLVVVEKDDGSVLTTNKELSETMNDIFVNWVKQGKIAQDEVHQIVFPHYIKTVDEWKECFDDQRVKATGLYLEESKEVVMENPYYSQVFSSISVGNGGEEKATMKFASEYVKSMLAWGKDSLMGVLKTEERLEQFVEDIVEVIALEPTKFRQDYIVQYVVARKRSCDHGRGQIRGL